MLLTDNSSLLVTHACAHAANKLGATVRRINTNTCKMVKTIEQMKSVCRTESDTSLQALGDVPHMYPVRNYAKAVKK